MATTMKLLFHRKERTKKTDFWNLVCTYITIFSLFMESEEKGKYLICSHCHKIMVTKKRKEGGVQTSHRGIQKRHILSFHDLLQSSFRTRPGAVVLFSPLCSFASMYLALSGWSVNICC